MDMPVQLLVFSIPSLIYLALSRRKGRPLTEALERLGWQGSRPVHYGWAIGVTLLVGASGWLAFQNVPPEVLQDPHLNVSVYAGWEVSIVSLLRIALREAFYVALGEEVFFRGFLGGWLHRRLGFAIGNLVQALVFLLPHLFVLLVSAGLWPILLVQLTTGWLLGWLRYRSGSILPGWLAHSLVNLLGALPALR